MDWLSGHPRADPTLPAISYHPVGHNRQTTSYVCLSSDGWWVVDWSIDELRTMALAGPFETAVAAKTAWMVIT